jgi:hypothetical protein
MAQHETRIRIALFQAMWLQEDTLLGSFTTRDIPCCFSKFIQKHFIKSEIKTNELKMPSTIACICVNTMIVGDLLEKA